MSFAELYKDVQEQDKAISTKWLVDKVKAYTKFTRVKEQWSSVLDQFYLRGVYIEGPVGPPVPMKENEVLIILSREMCKGKLGSHWRRIIKTKELMHVFDLDEEKAATPEQFDIQIARFGNPSKPMSPQYRAEA